MHNVDESSTHFSMDAREQFAVMKEIRENGYMLLANVHSVSYTHLDVYKRQAPRPVKAGTT